MSRPRLRLRRSSRARSRLTLPRSCVARMLPLPLLMGGCASDEDELHVVTDVPLARSA